MYSIEPLWLDLMIVYSLYLFFLVLYQYVVFIIICSNSQNIHTFILLWSSLLCHYVMYFSAAAVVLSPWNYSGKIKCSWLSWYRKPCPLTGWSALLIPTRNSDSAMKRLMQRFLWMVLRSLCSPRKKQKVKIQMRRHTSDSRIPTHVITSRSRSCILSAFC